MKEIKCPNCGQVFSVADDDYQAIVNQVRTAEFNKEIQERENGLESKIESAVNSAVFEEQKKNLREIEKKNEEIADLRNQLRDSELARRDAADEVSKAALTQQLAVEKAVREKENENSKLLMQIQADKVLHQQELQHKDEEIERYKEFKLRQSTKGIGESLEQYCRNEFEKIRATGFRNAYFEKDNDAKTGSKGDFIFKDYDDNGLEFISIMFEMKNEADETATKHKNEDFFKELDKDRCEKNCEYAVLVTMLEADNELYNQGIVDVSHKYDKMYVIRPQFLIPMITLLRNAALKNLSYIQQLEIARNQNIELESFEDKLNDFKTKFSKDVVQASNKFNDAIDKIDSTIKLLEKIKADLTSSNKHLLQANTKADNVTIKRLTKDSPTLAAKFAEIAEEKSKERE